MDAGFVGIKKAVACKHVWIPFKASKNQPLTKVQKAINYVYAHGRIVIENAIAKAKAFFVLRIENRMRIKTKLEDAFQLCVAVANFKTSYFQSRLLKITS